MALVTNNDLTQGLRGRVGKYFVFRQVRGRTIACRAPRKPDPKKQSDAQRLTRTRFREAAAWAVLTLSDPERKQYYQQRAEVLGLPNAYTAAVKDYMSGNAKSGLLNHSDTGQRTRPAQISMAGKSNDERVSEFAPLMFQRNLFTGCAFSRIVFFNFTNFEVVAFAILYQVFQMVTLKGKSVLHLKIPVRKNVLYDKFMRFTIIYQPVLFSGAKYIKCKSGHITIPPRVRASKSMPVERYSIFRLRTSPQWRLSEERSPGRPPVPVVEDTLPGLPCLSTYRPHQLVKEAGNRGRL